MTNGSSATGPIGIGIGITVMIYVLIGLAPLLLGHTSNTGSFDSQIETMNTTITGLFHPQDHPVASLIALAVGGLVACKQASD